jgi:hypothetical protein
MQIVVFALVRQAILAVPYEFENLCVNVSLTQIFMQALHHVIL